VPREDFLGPPPWSIVDAGLGGVRLAGDDPTPLYDDVLVVLDAERGVNNGSPSLHALMLHTLGVRPGERVLHIGAGGGYYSAILSELTGKQGRVTAIEYDARLAAAANAHLRPWPNVVALREDGATWPREEVDRIYVNFAVADPPARWTELLAEGGTLVFPLAAPAAPGWRRHSGTGAVLAITRTPTGFAVHHVSPCAFVCAEGPLAGTREQQARLAAALARPGLEFVRSYLRPAPASAERCWFWSPDWALSYDPPDAS
jgi:protein-L-isoaspartate(D-aspartate) O-methyltransferase